MTDTDKTRQQLLNELADLRRQVSELQQTDLLRQQAIAGVRERVWGMEHPDDIRDVVAAMGSGLRAIGVPFQNIGVNLVDPANDPLGISSYDLTVRGEWRRPEAPWASQLIHQIWRGGKPSYRPDLLEEDAHDERRFSEAYFGHPVRAVLDVPFSHGTVAINSDIADPFTEHGISVLEEMAKVLSEGVARMEDLRRLEGRAQEAESLASAIAMVGSTHELEEVLHAVVVESTHMLNTERGTLFLYDEAEGTLAPRAQVGHDWAVYRDVRLLPGEDMSGQVFSTGQPHLIDPDGAPVPSRRPATTDLFEQAVQGKELRGGAAVPLRLGGAVIGTLAVGTARRQLTGRDVEMLERLAEQTVLAIDRARHTEALELRNQELEQQMVERQRLEAQREARHRMREEVWRMEGTEDIERVLVALRDGLDALGVPFQDWGINVVDESTDPPTVRYHNMTRDGKRQVGEIGPEGRERIVVMWRRSDPVYRPDLEIEDPFNERPRIGRGFQHRARSVVDIPFSHGTLAVNSAEPRAFTDADIANLQEMAEVLSEGFRRREDLRQLADERERLLVTLRSIGDGVIATDAEGRTMLVNEAAEALTGWPHDEAVGRPLREVFRIIDEATHRPCEDPVSKVVKDGVTVGLANHTVLISRDGTERSIADSGAPIRDRDGRIIGVVLVFRDVTIQRRLEAELLKTEKLESLGVLAGGIAHDFNNILTSIIGCVSVAKMDAPPGDAIHATLTQVEEASWRAAQLTQQLLTFAKGGAPVRQLASLSEIIEESATFALRGSNVRFAFEFGDGLWPAEVDSGQISQVMQNLVINAHQAMPTGGTLRATARNVDVGPDRVVSLSAGSYVEITVTDEGVGIPPQHLQRIFDPYFSTKQKGSGLGLATVHSVIDNHGGRILVESQMGVGTTFTIHLPAMPQAGALPTAQEEAPTTGQGRILVVDDDEALLITSRRMLEVLGYEVDTADDGAAALAAYREAREAGSPFAAVILDLTIPGGMGGQEAISELLALDPEARAIASSGYANDPVMSEHGRYGFRGVVRKPYDLKELGRAIDSVLTGSP